MRYFLTFAIASFAAIASAEDWPQWQGPDRNATSTETGLLQEWPDSGPPLAWRIDGLGGGDSAPAVAGGRLFGMSNRDGKEIVWALSEEDGKEIWVTPLGDAVQQGPPQSSEGPACTPTIEGDRMYVIGMGGTVACLSVDDGEVIWKRNFTEDFGGTLPMWSYRESPLIDDDKVICTPGSSDALLVALNKLTGETVWTTKTATANSQSSGEGSRPELNANGEEQIRPSRPGQREMADRPRGANGGAPQVTGTNDSALFLSEHWGMTAFAHKVPNGKYVVKLYFAETYSGITGAGGRVFSMDVEGTELNDFDIWQKAGGPNKAYVEAVPVEVKDGEFNITFTRQTESPAIKAIKIIPQRDDANDSDTIRIKAGQTTPFTDSEGNVWLAETGFTGGSTSPGFFNFGGGGFGRSTRGSGRGSEGRSGAAYASVIPIDFEGDRQYVQLTASSLVGVSADDGEILWQYSAPANSMGINCSTPIYQDGVVFAASAYGNGGGAAKLVKSTDGKIEAEEVYFSRNMQNHHGGMIVVDGALYGANGGNGGGFMVCMDFQTGDILWRERDAPKGSLLLADNRLYLRAEEGEVILIEPSRKELIVRGRFQQPDRSSSPAWAHPVIANGKLYIRDQGLLLCYDVKEMN
ncbi:PQQ-binding-like beta-propeller repeat protein [Thalassoglobus sp. JC818]|uniref:outer membrane protein assembly factor BamB family protein n=1 Tax=Thalassoglobus sp. JC818 TaxID=3232136 RepID=UPI0034580EC4